MTGRSSTIAKQLDELDDLMAALNSGEDSFQDSSSQAGPRGSVALPQTSPRPSIPPVFQSSRPTVTQSTQPPAVSPRTASISQKPVAAPSGGVSPRGSIAPTPVPAVASVGYSSRGSIAPTPVAAPSTGVSPRGSVAPKYPSSSFEGRSAGGTVSQPVASSGNPICFACRQPFANEYIQVQEKNYHVSCLKCTGCGKALGTGAFYEDKGSPYCQPCYNGLLCPTCGFCGENIVEKDYITALGKTWHHDHFKCCVCKMRLGQNNESFYEKNGRTFCEADYVAEFAPKCAKCNQAITGELLEAVGKVWHPEHFSCMTCGVSFKGRSYYIHNNLPFCQEHHKQAAATSTLCPGCSAPVAGATETLIALGKVWHKDHFKCQFCTRSLENDNFVEKDGQAYCAACHRMMYSS